MGRLALEIKFLGATGTVTGSKYLVTHKNKQILVDCGLFQGHKELRERNWHTLPIEAKSIDAVVLTHAHIDHTGYTPLLVRQGFRGPIYSTEATYDLCAILLPDSGYLQEEDARRANRYGYTKHHPALPLYTQEDAQACLQQFSTLDYSQSLDLGEGLTLTLERAGHILGSSVVTLNDGQKSILFTGDLGRTDDPMMLPPAQIPHTDYLVLESTYGNRQHKKTEPVKEMGEIIRATTAKGGHVIIPAFAVGRAQMILYIIHQLKQQKTIPDIPIFLDSPMAINATKLLCKYSNEHKFAPGLCQEICGSATYTPTVEESKAIAHIHMPSIIITASGMATGGRVLHHLKHYLPDPKNTILFTGFQAAGTRGHSLVGGQSEVKIHGEMYPVRARVENLSNTSAHSDYHETLAWLKGFARPPKKVFLTHGEPKASASLKRKIEQQLGWKVVLPKYLQKEKL